MAKIIVFGEFQQKLKQEKFERDLQKAIEEVEKRLDIPEGEDLLVLSDINALTIGNCLLDAQRDIINAHNAINRVLDILSIEEGDIDE